MKSAMMLFLLVSCSSSTTAQPSLDEEVARDTIKTLLKGRIAENDKSIMVSNSFVDLNGDNENEVVVYAFGDTICGSGGCNVYILERKGSQYRQVTKLTISRPPIRVFTDRSMGWANLSVWVQGGGITPGYEALLRFDGETYPSNPSLEPRAEPRSGRVIIHSLSPAKPLY